MPVRLFVGNLPYDATEEDIRAHFSTAGNVLNVFVPLDRETGRKRGFAFVEFNDNAQARRPSGCSTASRSRDVLWPSTKPAQKRAGRPSPGGGGGFRPGPRPPAPGGFRPPGSSDHPAALRPSTTAGLRSSGSQCSGLREPTNTLASSVRTPSPSRTETRRYFDRKAERRRSRRRMSGQVYSMDDEEESTERARDRQFCRRGRGEEETQNENP